MSLSALKMALITLAILASGRPGFAQTAPEQQPYAGLQTREIKALSHEQMADLAAGRGMGLALAAELNGYPGPRHVLDFAEQLKLTDEQRASVQILFDSMKSEAVPLGQKLLSAERELDRAFAERTITPDRLQAMTAAVAEAQGKLRNAHLKYHLATAALLNPDQIHRYSELRGYMAAGGPKNHMMTPPPGATGSAMHPQMDHHCAMGNCD
jgi:Spy/CpxP family protein refolding chaperone